MIDRRRLGKEDLEQSTRALCFEFMDKGSLQKHLSDESCGLDWETRYNIIKGTCEGLRYIHEGLEEPLLHLDLKLDNILLDTNMVPKTADFGLSRIFGDQLTMATQCSFGTLGYKPPEYIDKKKISKKFDIFSLGVIIIQIVSGPESYHKCLDRMTSGEFVDQVCKNWRKRWQATCNSDFSLEAYCRQVETCTQIALDCLEKDWQKRPDIVKIFEELNKIEPGINKENYLGILQPTKRKCQTVCGMVEWDNRQETSFDAGKELIIGREEEKKRMASSIESMPEKIIILPIYGVGGIGKTTFARLIYNDTKFRDYSQVWVYVSTRFDLCKIGNSIISQLSGKENQANDLELIKCCLTKLLNGKNILIVLDDLWQNNTIELVDLKDMLDPGDSKKRIVLVTTRSEEIAKKMCINIKPYKIQALEDEMCLDIIKQKSDFEGRHDKEKLEGIGKDIARKCGGVALAAQTLGSMLQSMEYDQWISVRDSDIWNETISNDLSLPNHVLASLKLSYLTMDKSLKFCFKYCAIFPKGHKIVKRDIIYQWISLGFIEPTLLSSPLELCEKYIVRLLGLSFIQYSISLSTYQQYGVHDIVFTMHDLVHDLATSLLGDEILDQSRPGNTNANSSKYALILNCSKSLESCTTSPASLSALRFLDYEGSELSGFSFESAKSLQVLDLSECSIQKLPDSISRLTQLRYLNAPRIRGRMVPECITSLSNLSYLSLRGSYAILALPQSIGRLEGLVYLDLSGCVGIKELPESIGGMEGLVHLDLSGCMGIKELPESFGNLTSLEHLDFAYCENVIGLSQCLARLTKLQHLNLLHCKNIEDLPIALGSLTELRYLNLSDSSRLSGNRCSEAAFLGSLTKLRYLNLSSRKKPMSKLSLPQSLDSLTELEYLDLSYNMNIGKLPASFQKLCSLVHLDLSGCFFLKGIPEALNGLTKLQYLNLSRVPRFLGTRQVQEVFGNLSELRYLNLHGCLSVRGLPYPGQDEINCLLGRICTLSNLEYLNLGYNAGIISIPETVANLKNLNTLDISFTPICRLPASISEINSLKFLHTKKCGMLDISTLPQYMRSSRILPNSVGHTGGGESTSHTLQLEYESYARLKISGLENVKSAKEARTIELVDKIDVTQLALVWTRDAKRFVDDAEVLRELEPPYSVTKFRLEGYNSVSFPPWVMRINDYLPGLTKIEISDLPSCNNLPPLGHLPNLKHLYIRRMDSIKKIDADLYGGPRPFSQFLNLVIEEMKCLEEWNTVVSGDQDFFFNNPRLPQSGSVKIIHCPSLRFKPCPPQCGRLEIEHSDEVMLSSLENRGQVSLLMKNVLRHGHEKDNRCRVGASAIKDLLVGCCAVPLYRWSLLCQLPYLRKLKFVDCSDLTCSSPDFLGGLTSLRSLTVRHCQSIVSLPEMLGDLASLRKLKICECKGIKTLPDSIHKLPRLETLKVVNCENIVSLPERLGDLTSLEELKILGCTGIKTLPESLRQLTLLWNLTVQDCESITSLPEGLGDLASLMWLEIRGCSGIKTLPDTIHKLTNLQQLRISGCHELIHWCELKENKMKLTHIKERDFS
ncbi:hypothetical protein HU200_052882 [Digitaria exilis]|uniref:Protein kinase domain-containing protein n=1 Tax=Digitaria exilis TaxID=1010633 RepID=A0A835E8T1_9POAL|nr:hypothetical protein HU200_052882 [Digitaria exilis]